MFAQVIVKTKIPSIGKTYTYIVPKELEKLAMPGKEVSIPFGKKACEGLILSLSYATASEFKLKEITYISPHPAILPESNLHTALWLSSYYSSNFFDCIAGMLPKDYKRERKHIIENENIQISTGPKLTQYQETAIKEITKHLHSNRKFLLHGVTGSGKTEVYLQITQRVIAEGKQVLFMVPEISLTPQLIERFSQRFGAGEVAVIHSKIHAAIKIDSWNNIKTGEKKIIIGSRSAILSPFYKLGCILIDECHEQSYKQDKDPKYNTIELGEYLSNRENIPLILGSATPLIEQYHMAKTGVYTLLSLPERISKHSTRNIIIDLKEAKQRTNYPLLSKPLIDKINSVLTKSEQSILYLNRRGTKTGLICTRCGHYETCPNCNMPLSIHLKQRQYILLCHHCFFTKPIPDTCSLCSSKFIKGIGMGTQAIQSQLEELFPKKSIAIMDKDTTQKKGSHERIFSSFAQKKIDVLIGTQMITKGWDIGNVSLTSYLLLDSDLIFPSFRTSERVYQLITQLAGRSGRANKEGTNIIQTYNPNNPILKDALTYNFEEFYTKELEMRKNLLYPPFVDLIQVISKATNEKKALLTLKNYIRALNKDLEWYTSSNQTHLLGPSRCFIPKVNNIYFFQCTVKIRKEEELEKKNESFREIVQLINKTKRPNGLSINIHPFDLQ